MRKHAVRLICLLRLLTTEWGGFLLHWLQLNYTIHPNLCQPIPVWLRFISRSPWYLSQS